MKKELQDKIFKKYPKIFRQRKLSMRETAMCWGLEIGDGWYDLIDNLCSVLEKICPEVEATQVKEKWGGVRFYVCNSNNDADFVIRLAEHKSYYICEKCGEAGEIRDDKYWLVTLCDKCNKKRK
jgi:hypothetical protein